MTLYVKKGSAWQAVGFDDLSVKVSGTWRVPVHVYVKTSGIWRPQVWAANVAPPSPASVTATRLNGGQARVQWTWPPNPENDYDEAQIEMATGSGAFVPQINVNHPTVTWTKSGLTHGVNYTFRIRSKDDSGKFSGYVTAATISALDQLPGIPVINSVTWGTSAFTVNWSNPGNPESDITAVQVFAKESSEVGMEMVHSEAWVGGSRSRVVPNRAYDRLHSFRINVVSPGGTSQSPVVTSWSPPAPGTTKNILCVDAGSYSYGAGTWTIADDHVRQGRLNATTGLYFGGFFYGANLYNACHGHTPVASSILMIRAAALGNNGNAAFVGHGYQTKPTGAPGTLGTPWVGTGIYDSADASQYETIPIGMAAMMADGTLRGFGVYHASTSPELYRVWRGPDSVGTAGTIRLEW